ncbi:MAG: hypothetical protein AB8H80_13840 [Planctomycetota bacterium]
MRISTLFAGLALSSLAVAQTPALTTTFAGGNGQSGNMFDIVALNVDGVTIDYFDVNLDPGTWDLEVYKLTVPGPYQPSVNTAADWTLIGSTTGVVSNGNNVPTQLPIGVCEFIPSGATQAFYVTVTNGTSINYTNGGTTGDVFASNADLQFLEGAGLAYPFSSDFNPRVFNGTIYYRAGNDPSLCPVFSSKEVFGSGCYDLGASFYEVQDALSMDLGGTILTGTWNGSGYDVTTAPGAGSIAPGAGATAIALGDDVEEDTAVAGGTLGLWVGSNCWVAQGSGNSTGFAPSIAEFLNNPSTGVYAWTDLQPNASGSGQVFYEESGTVATVTYDGVYGWGTTDPNTVQIIWDTATGDFSIEFGVLSVNNPEDWLVGFSDAANTVDAGPTDLSAGMFSVAASDISGLSLDSNSPEIGVNWDLVADNAGASPIAVFFFGDMAIDPGIDLGAFGAPGCSAYTNANIDAFVAPVVSGMSTFTVVVPNDPTLLGTELTAQATAATALNMAGFGTSNGLKVTLGNF